MTEKPRKAKEGHLKEGRTATPTKGTKRGKPKKRAKKSSKSKQSEQEVLKIEKLKMPPEINLVSKEFNQLCAHTLPLWQ
jgi:hypothetical protein